MDVRNWSFWRDGDRLRLRVVSDHPRWQFWRPRLVTCFFNKEDAIFLYQSLLKAARPLMVQAERDVTPAEEFADDVTRAILEADRRAGNVPSGEPLVQRGDPWYEYIAELLKQKGYTKT